MKKAFLFIFCMSTLCTLMAQNSYLKYDLSYDIVSGGLAHGDLDNDGDEDVIAYARSEGDFIWYENIGAADFIPHTIPISLELSTDYTKFYFEVVDLDQDMDVDVIISDPESNQIIWMNNCYPSNSRINWYISIQIHSLTIYVSAVFTIANYFLNMMVNRTTESSIAFKEWGSPDVRWTNCL